MQIVFISFKLHFTNLGGTTLLNVIFRKKFINFILQVKFTKTAN